MESLEEGVIKETVVDILFLLGFEATVEVVRQSEPIPTFLCAIQVKTDQNFLIGQYGVNLAALQHIIRVVLRKKLVEKAQILIDVNDYFFEKQILLKQEAKKAASDVLLNNKASILRPMLPYERKIVHAFLAENDQVTTESTGKGEERRITISPKV